MITKILVGIDGSETSQKAVDYALEIAEKFSASIHLLNVFQYPVELGNQPNVIQLSLSAYPQEETGYPPSIMALLKELRNMHEVILTKATERANMVKPNLKITSELKEGESPSVIVETAVDGQFDLIVIGHRVDSRFNELFLGATSESVAHQARCPVLIVK